MLFSTYVAAQAPVAAMLALGAMLAACGSSPDGAQLDIAAPAATDVATDSTSADQEASARPVATDAAETSTPSTAVPGPHTGAPALASEVAPESWASVPDAVVRAEPHDRIDDRGVVTAEGPHDTVFVPAAARRDSGVHLLAYEYSVDEVSAMVAGWADGSGLLDEQDYVALPEGALVIRTEPRLQVELAVADLYANFLIQPAPGESETPISPQQMIDWAERLAERVVAERA